MTFTNSEYVYSETESDTEYKLYLLLVGWVGWFYMKTIVELFNIEII